LRFMVRLTPKGRRDAIEGWSRDAAGQELLKARVAAPPEDGKANAALIGLVAEALKVGRTKVRIVSGGASRLKTLEVEGDSVELAARLRQAGTKA